MAPCLLVKCESVFDAKPWAEDEVGKFLKAYLPSFSTDMEIEVCLDDI